MAGVSPELLSDDLYRDMLLNQAWQQQLTNGANIANSGWQTALGLALGTGLGNWLGYKFGNWQRVRDDDRKDGQNSPLKNNPAVRAAVNNLLGGDVYFGWAPQKNPYPFPATRAERLAGVGEFNPNWRQDFINRKYPIPNFWNPPQATANSVVTPQTTPQANPPPPATQSALPTQQSSFKPTWEIPTLASQFNTGFDPNWRRNMNNTLYPTNFLENPNLFPERLKIPAWQVTDSPWTRNMYSL